jgi:hypothetical protein
MTMDVRIVKMVWYQDLNKLVRETYGVEYDVGRQYEMGQDTIIQADADGAYGEPLTDKDWSAEYGPDVEEVMCDLARRGLIDEGSYVVHVWW